MSGPERHELVIDVLGRPHLSNAERRLSHWALRRIHGDWRAAASGLAMAERFPKGLGPAKVSAYGRYRRGPLPDAGGVAPSLKCCVDGLVDHGCWPADSSEWVLSETCLPPVVDPLLPDALVVIVEVQ